jgi:UDP-glucose 4-epimerase
VIQRPLIAITGSSGFIGRRFVDAVRSRGYRVRHLTRSPDPTDTSDDIRHFNLLQDRIDPAALEDCETLVHLAAHIPADHFDPDEAERCWRANALGTLRLAEAAVQAGVRRFIQTTSANAYAAREWAPAETAAMLPQSRGYYLGSKILQEVYAREICGAGGLPLVTLRLGSVYGPGQRTGAVAALAGAFASGHPVALQNGGRFGADFVHVDDVVAALMLVAEGTYDEPFNVGSGVRTSILALARMLASEIEVSNSLIHVEPETADDDFGFPALCIARIQSLGYNPRDLKVGLASMVAGPTRA